MITPKLIIRYINDRWKKRIVGDEMPLDIQKEAIELIEEYAQYKVNELNKSDVKSNEAIQSENKKESEVAVDFAEIERLIEEYKKEELPNANEPFHYEAEAAAGFKYFIQWLKRKSAKATDR